MHIHTFRAPLFTLLAVAVTVTPLAFAADQETEAQARQACIDSLNIPDYLLATGSYKIRVDNCVRQRMNVNLSLDRKARLLIRQQIIQERLARNSRALTVVPQSTAEEQQMTAPTRQDRFPAVYRPQDVYQKLLRGQRPSKRWIINQAGMQRQQPSTSTVSKEDLQKALDACSGVGEGYWRSSCVNNALRRLRQPQ